MKDPAHVYDNPISKLYRESKYRLPMNNPAYLALLTFLESKSKQGGAVIIYLLNSYCEIRTADRGPIQQYSFEAIYKQIHGSSSLAKLEEGIPGAFTGVSNKDLLDNTAALRLGMMPMEADLAADVRAELEDEDARGPSEGGRTLIDEFERTIKREETPDGPNRIEIPFPPSRARDVAMEVQKIRESRDRFRIEGRTGGIGPAVSVCMFTFHNTLDRLASRIPISY